MFNSIDVSINAFLPHTSARFAKLKIWQYLDDNPQFEGSGDSWVDSITRGWSADWIAAEMQKGDVEKGLLISSCVTSGAGGEEILVTLDEVVEVVDRYPDRFAGLVGVNPLKGMETIRYVNRAVRDNGFKGVHIYPHWFGVYVNDRKYYPIYAKCAELDVPICMQISMPTPASGTLFCGRPSLLETVAMDFPELRIVALHAGFPLVDELLLMCSTHENIYIGADAFPPSSWPRGLVDYINTAGRNRVMWGSDFPIQHDWAGCISQLKDVIPDKQIQKKILRDNALACFNL